MGYKEILTKTLPKPWVLIGFSSTDQSRTWKRHYFIQLIQLLNKLCKYTFFLVGAPYEKQDAKKIIKLVKIKKGKMPSKRRTLESGPSRWGVIFTIVALFKQDSFLNYLKKNLHDQWAFFFSFSEKFTFIIFSKVSRKSKRIENFEKKSEN